MNRRFRQILKSTCRSPRAQAGFTLMELLAALAILAVLGTMVTSAMLTGSRVMEESTAGANASVLEQSIGTALSDLLHYACVTAPAGAETVDNPTFDSDSHTDFSGSAIRAGRIAINNGKLSLETANGVQAIPKAEGIYTDFSVTDFQYSYDCKTNVFSGFYTLSNNGSYERTCEFACRTLVEEVSE